MGTLDVLLSSAYCRSQRFLSKQLAQLRPELTMSIFSGKCWHSILIYAKYIYTVYIIYISFSLSLSVEITHRFQSAREDVRALLLQCLLPWLQNMELVATSVPPATPLSYIMVSLSSRRRLMKGVKRGFSWCLSYCFFITLQAKCFASSKVRKAETV